MNNLISDLLQLLFGYLTFIKIEKHPQLQTQLLLDELFERELHTHAQHVLSKYRRLHEKDKYQSVEHFQNNYYLNEKQDRLLLSKAKRSYNEHLQNQSNAFDLYYFSNKLRLACDMLSRNMVVNANYECHFLNEILEFYKQNRRNIQDFPALKVYYKTLQMLKEKDDEKTYFEWKELAGHYGELFPKEELQTIYDYGLNYCVRKINTGKTKFYREIFDLYQILLDRKLLLKNGYISQWAYINIVTTAMRLKEFDWTEEFIHSYKEALQPKVQQNVYMYNLAALYFEKKDYKNALFQLHDVEFTDAFFHMSAKIIQLKSYFELDETEAFFALAEATKKYLRRNRHLSEYQIKSNQSFLKFITKIYQKKLQAEMMSVAVMEKNYENLFQQISTTSTLSNKDWLLKALPKNLLGK
ncbi:MAG: hypothetical protein GY705_14140 [Bacteroidetes bacterium]|nr:hypothetical protein [Bacteroidota bacterium]